MREGGDRPRLPLEPRKRLRPIREIDRENLYRDVSVQLRIPRAIDLAHAAGTERRDDFIGAEAGAGNQRHGGCRVDAALILVFGWAAAKEKAARCLDAIPSRVAIGWN